MKYRFLAVVLLLLLGVSLILPSAAAPTSLLVLGDSISTGYGLLPDADRQLQSYGNQLADAFSLSGDAYHNAAVNGATSADLLALLPSIEPRVKAADTIVISIGGNDVLGKMLNLLQQATATTSLTAAIDALQTVDMTIIGDSFSTDAVHEEFDTALQVFGQNIEKIIALLEQMNPHAQVVFLTQYDPLNGADRFFTPSTTTEPDLPSTDGASSLLAFTEQVITGLNATLTHAVANSTICSAVDVYAAFYGQGGTLTRIYEADIHPNQAGHDKIFALLRDHIDTLPPHPVFTETTTASTTNETSTSAPTSSTALTTLEPLPLDDTSNTVPIVIILGLAILCMVFGLLRMCLGKKRG